MKKIVYYFVAALALIACTPKNGADQVVRIGVSLDDDAQPNQKGQQRISAEDQGSVIKILWEDEDVLYYQLDGGDINKTNPFKLISGAETKQAVFECEAPEDLLSKTFSLYYNGKDENGNDNPGGQIPLDQNSEANKVNHNYLFYSAHKCKTGSGINLEPNFTLLGIRFVSTTEITFAQDIAIGTDVENDIISYTCNPGTVSINSNDLNIFYIVLPEGYDLTNQEIGLISSRGHNCSNQLDLSSITLSPNTAKIITISVTRNPSVEKPQDYGAYTIAKSVTPNN